MAPGAGGRRAGWARSWHSAYCRRDCARCATQAQATDVLPSALRRGIGSGDPPKIRYRACRLAAALALVLGGGILAAGCGQKGDLYLPKEEKKAEIKKAAPVRAPVEPPAEPPAEPQVEPPGEPPGEPPEEPQVEPRPASSEGPSEDEADPTQDSGPEPPAGY